MGSTKMKIQDFMSSLSDWLCFFLFHGVNKNENTRLHVFFE
jgi:hypothetical protein